MGTQPAAANLNGFLIRTLAVLAVLAAMRFALPPMLEVWSYSATLGRQRAAYRAAGEMLQDNALANLSQAYQMVSARVAPSVVHIETRAARPEPDRSDSADASRDVARSPIWRDEQRGQGSGVIVSSDGFVLTNLHVLEGYDEFQVKVNDGRQFTAQVVGWDRLTDLALLKVPARDLVAAEWADSDQLAEGALVWALGSPFGFQHSITSGIISAKNRGGQAGTAYQDFLQTDAAVNPGNSGGPLVDAQGRVVGINTMIVGPAFQGVSLAIPSNVARRTFHQLRDQGHVSRSWLGIGLEQVTEEVARRLRLSRVSGALVTQLVPSAEEEPSPARQAGLRPGDVIVEWDGEEVLTTAKLSQTIAGTPAGTEVPLVILRDGMPLSVSVRVQARPPQWN